MRKILFFVAVGVGGKGVAVVRCLSDGWSGDRRLSWSYLYSVVKYCLKNLNVKFGFAKLELKERVNNLQERNAKVEHINMDYSNIKQTPAYSKCSC